MIILYSDSLVTLRNSCVLYEHIEFNNCPPQIYKNFVMLTGNMINQGVYFSPVRHFSSSASPCYLLASDEIPLIRDRTQQICLPWIHVNICRIDRLLICFCRSLPGNFRRIKSLRDPTSKMSKSEPDIKSRIELTDSPDEIRMKFRKAVTDMQSAVTFDPETRPGVSNLVEICSAVTEKPVDEVVQGATHADTLAFKSVVAEAVIERLRPIREEVSRLKADRGHLVEVLKEGQERARDIASKNYSDVKRLIGMID